MPDSVYFFVVFSNSRVVYRQVGCCLLLTRDRDILNNVSFRLAALESSVNELTHIDARGGPTALNVSTPAEQIRLDIVPSPPPGMPTGTDLVDMGAQTQVAAAGKYEYDISTIKRKSVGVLCPMTRVRQYEPKCIEPNTTSRLHDRGDDVHNNDLQQQWC